MYSRLVDARHPLAESSQSASVENHPRLLVMQESQSRNIPAIGVDDVLIQQNYWLKLRVFKGKSSTKE